MQVIIPKDDDEVGHFSWELPDEIAAFIEQLPPDKQEMFREMVTGVVRVFLHSVAGAIHFIPATGAKGLLTVNEHLLNMNLAIGKLGHGK